MLLLVLFLLIRVEMFELMSCQGLQVLRVIFDAKCLASCLNDEFICVSHFRLFQHIKQLPLVTALVVTPYRHTSGSFIRALQKSLCVLLCSDPGQVWNGWEKRHSTTGEQLPEGPQHQWRRYIWWSQAGQALEQGVYVHKRGRKESTDIYSWNGASGLCPLFL